MSSKKFNNKKYAYADWWEGRIYFSGTQIYPSKGDAEKSAKAVKLVHYYELSDLDQQKIKKKQKELFEKGVLKLLTQFQKEFTGTMSTSLDKAYYRHKTISDLGHVLRNQIKKVPHGGGVMITCPNMLLNSDQINALNSYYHYQILKGRQSHEFMQSPKQKVPFFVNPPTEVLTAALFEFWMWLEAEDVEDQRKEPDAAKPIQLHSKLTADQIDLLFDLVHQRFMDESVSIENFRLLFSNDPGAVRRIRWTGSVKLLAYLFDQLLTYRFIANSRWKKVLGDNYLVFESEQGTILKSTNITSALYEVGKFGKPDGHQDVDDLLASFKNPEKP